MILLNKMDLCPEVASRFAEVEKSTLGVRVCGISALTGDGIETLSPDLCKGETVVLLGSSGVGKSNLTNRLLGAEAQAVRAVRGEDSRLRHTTTAGSSFFCLRVRCSSILPACGNCSCGMRPKVCSRPLAT